MQTLKHEWPSTLMFEGAEMYLEERRIVEAIYRQRNMNGGKVCVLMLRSCGHCSWHPLHESYEGPTVSVDRWPDETHKWRWKLSHTLSNAEWEDAVYRKTLVVSSEGVDLSAEVDK